MTANQTLSSVSNALRLLDEFTTIEPVLGVSELARRLELGKSTTHRLLSTLTAAGYVERTADERYRLGIRLWELGARVIDGLELREIAHPYLVQLRNATGETTHLSVLDGNEVVYIERIESQSTLTLFRRVGHRNYAHTTSSGKAMLAMSPNAVIEEVLAGELAAQTPSSLSDPVDLRRELVKIRKRGWAMSMNESEVGVSSLAAPVFGHDGEVIAAISVAGPSPRMNRQMIRDTTGLVREAAKKISHGMGYLERRQATG